MPRLLVRPTIDMSLKPLFGAFLLLAAGFALAQDGVSTAGAARAKYLSGLGLLPSSKEVIVEDFVNYHRHEIGRPKAGEAVGLDLRWEQEAIGKDAVLQIGLSTALANDKSQLRPLNLALVIDKSGSMLAEDKMNRVKASLERFVSQLRPTDTLSIVLFDDESEVLLPATKLTDPQMVRRLIRGIHPGGSTNINGGLMLGYKEALKNYRKEATNRVILLTDGIANRGVTEPREIAKGSVQYNDKGIDLSTIGVGLDLNKDLLMDLAKSGRGLYHFVADNGDMDKVFTKEAQSLMSPVALSPSVEVTYGPGLKLSQTYGYQPTSSKGKVRFKLDNMNSGMTQVILLRFDRGSAESAARSHHVTVKLDYHDVDRNKGVSKSDITSILDTWRNRNVMNRDRSVSKNVTIANLAQAIRDMAAFAEKKDYRQAERVLSLAISEARESYPSGQDPDIQRTLETAEGYQKPLRDQLAMDPLESDGAVRTKPTVNLIPNGDFALGNQGFTSDIPYIKPEYNCLWAVYYTIAPRFDQPQLHRLIAAEPFAAPRQEGQVFYANAGGTETMVVLSTKVKCNPQTKYRISFQTISLTPGAAWIPTYEIRVNGERSEPQSAADRVYKGVTFEWESKGATSATVQIVRMPIPHGGGLIGIADLDMRPIVSRGG